MPNSPIRPGSEEEWEALLHQLRQQPQPQPQPFFYARVQAKLTSRHQAASVWLPGWVRRPAYALVVGALLVAVSGDAAVLRPTAAAKYQPRAHRPSQPVLSLPH